MSWFHRRQNEPADLADSAAEALEEQE